MTEERREERLLRRQGSSETDEQIIQLLRKTRPSWAEENGDFLNIKIKLAEREELPKVNEMIRPLKGLDEQSGNGKSCIQPTDEKEEQPAEELCGWRRFDWEEYSRSLHEEEKSSDSSSIPTKFFVEQKPDTTVLKPSIYRNINVVYEFKSRLGNGTHTIVNVSSLLNVLL